MRRLVMLAVLSLVIASCGSGDDSGAGADAQVTTTAAAEADSTGDDSTDETSAPTTEAAADEPSDDGGSSNDFEGQGAATVTLGGETYYFGDAGFPAIQCQPDFFGVMMVALERVDESGNALAGGSLRLVLLHEGTDPATVGQLNEMEIKIDELDQEWIADETDFDERELAPGTSQVDSLSISGNSASGTATLYDENSYWGAGGDPDAVDVTTASFEVTCAEE